MGSIHRPPPPRNLDNRSDLDLAAMVFRDYLTIRRLHRGDVKGFQAVTQIHVWYSQLVGELLRDDGKLTAEDLPELELYKDLKRTDVEYASAISLRVMPSYLELNTAASKAGVELQDILVFNETGQRAFNGGLSIADVKRRKGIHYEKDYAFCMTDLELNCVNFIMKLTANRLSKGDINDNQTTTDTYVHYSLAARRLLAGDNDPMPEDMPVYIEEDSVSSPAT